MTRTEREASRNLRRAAELLELATSDLNTDGHVCDGCGSLRRDNWTEFQVDTGIRNLPTKLRDFASKLENI
jgi:hypothetical protein